jgi:beta-1,4-mannosyltransferase
MGTTTSRVQIACFPPLLRENPYQRILYESLEPLGFDVLPSAPLKLGWLLRSRRQIDILHLHWPESYYRSSGQFAPAFATLRVGLFAFRLVVARILGFTIVWTVHQVLPHEDAGAIDRLAARMIAFFANLLFVHDELTRQRVEAELGAGALRKVKVVPHAAYLGAYPEGRSREIVRADLGIPDGRFVFLVFGHVRRYKMLGPALNAFRSAPDLDAALVVAGLPVDTESAAEVRDAAARDSRIVPFLEFIPDECVSELFAAADACIMARIDGGTSGALVLALSLGVPTVIPSVAPWKDMVGEAGWTYRAGDQSSLGEALARAAVSSPDVLRRKRQAALAKAAALSPASVAFEVSRYLRDELGSISCVQNLPSQDS